MIVKPADGVVVLDTNVVSEPLRPDPEPEVIAFLRRVSARTFITTVALTELFYGAWRLDAGNRRHQPLENIAEIRNVYRTRTLTLTAEAAENYGRSVADLQRAGTQIGRADAYIAAICVTYGVVLATRDTKDFANYPELRVRDPWTP